MKELQFRLTESIQADVLRTLFGSGPEQGSWGPERGFLGIIAAGTGVRRRLLMLRSIVDQEEGWVTEGPGGLTFSPAYFSKAVTLANQGPPGSGVVIVHSHPGGDPTGGNWPRPSSPDLQHERQLLWVSQAALRSGAPVAAGIVGANGRWRVREYSWARATTPREATSRRFGPNSGSFSDASSVGIVGTVSSSWLRPASRLEPPEKATESTMNLWGPRGQSILAEISLGIAGAGGVGSMVVEQAARLGVGHITLVDYDVLKEENLNRAEGAGARDLGRPKIDYLVRQARKAATCDDFKINAMRASVCEWEGLRPLLDCDVILNAADGPFARQVLDQVAYAFELPLIDGGTVFLVGSGGEVVGRSQVSEAGPGRPCLECQGVYTREEATMARESPSQQGPFRYVVPTFAEGTAEAPRAPSVISHNGLVASLMVQRLLRTVLGFPPRTGRFQQRFYVESGEIRWGPVTTCSPACPKPGIVGVGDGYPIPVGVDPFLDALRHADRGRQRAASA